MGLAIGFSIGFWIGLSLGAVIMFLFLMWLTRTW